MQRIERHTPVHQKGIVPVSLSTRLIMPTLILFLSGAHVFCMAAERPKPAREADDPAFAPVEEDPSLPRILLIGDSISIGYTPPVREMLRGKANVLRIPENGASTIKGLEKLDEWLGEQKWDVIHFNWGLHDLRRDGPGGRKSAEPMTTPAVYEANLRQLTARLRRTGARLVWASTTTVPEGEPRRRVEDLAVYNAAALRVMEENRIPVDDLCAVSANQCRDLHASPGNVHYTPEGSRVLARAVAECLTGQLEALKGHDETHALPKLRVRSVQMPVTDSLETNLRRIEKGIDEAAAAGARLVLFPETALSGFTEAAVAGLDWRALSGAMEKVAELAKARGIYVLYGSATPSHTARPFNTAILVDPSGAEVMRYHKMIPERWFEPGGAPALFAVDGIPCTVIICHDNRFPELVRLPVLAGARICFYISYEINGVEAARRKKEGYRAQLIARAVENGVWVAQSNGVGPLGADHLSLGCSRVVDPAGTVVAEAPELEEHVLDVEIDPNTARRGNALESLESKFFGDWWKEGLAQMKARERGMETAEKTEKPRSRVRLALMREVPVKWDLDKNFGVFLKRLDEAPGADVFITPECWLDGYAAADKGSTPERLRETAQSLEGSPYLDRVAEEARKRNMYLCFGFTSLEDGHIYNSAGLWDRQGKLLGVYHKTHLQTHDLQFSPGADLPVWQTDFGATGVMICADRRWPETARTLRLKGARILLNPTYGMHHLANEWWMRTRGFENQCFIAFAHPETSFVVTPKGELAAKASDAPGVLLCDIDPTAAREDNHLADRRPDLYGIISEKK